jgi:hypothetical protein
MHAGFFITSLPELLTVPDALDSAFQLQSNPYPESTPHAK